MQTIHYKDKTIHIISTAHVSKESIVEVKEAIDTIKPDVVCIELDRNRADALMNPSTKDIDIKEIIKKKKVVSFLSNLILSNFQKQIADDLDTKVGAEMVQAIESANENGIAIRYIDRDIQITMNRIWNKFNLWKKLNLGVSLFATLLDDTEVSEEDIEKLKESDMLMATIEDLEGEFPEISEVILHERNYYMAEKIKNIPYSTMVVVIGAAHTKGMIAAFDETHDLKELETVVEKKKNNWIGFILPGTLLLLITLLTLKSPQMAFQELLAWIITSSSLAALGALLSGAHIVTILVSFLTAFIGILSPVLAVGIFAGLTEAYFRPPFAKEFESLSSDMKSIKGWYKNRVLRIILIFFMTSILSSIGSFVAGKNIIQSLFK